MNSKTLLVYVTDHYGDFCTQKKVVFVKYCCYAQAQRAAPPHHTTTHSAAAALSLLFFLFSNIFSKNNTVRINR
jgi:hypothetical protein